ncbi:hypothetical protein [Leadbetterella byssophila]|uniref:hypothetical protein n=1 Tax=Leadbetterella byssophila TaxID=316068 RepID=UPI0039A19A90
MAEISDPDRAGSTAGFWVHILRIMQLDIDNKKLAKVNSPLKEKINILPNGASHGERGIISERYYRKQLSLSKDTRVRILDSLQIDY